MFVMVKRVYEKRIFMHTTSVHVGKSWRNKSILAAGDSGGGGGGDSGGGSSF